MAPAPAGIPHDAIGAVAMPPVHRICTATPATRRQFASDPLNLTLSAPEVNRCNAGGKSAATTPQNGSLP